MLKYTQGDVMYSNEIIIKILNYLNTNITQKISIDDISKKFNYDKAYLMRLFKKEIGLTIVDYLNKIKIYNSLDLLKENNLTILNIALKNGFYNQEYFSEIFKKTIGISPKEYQNFILRKANYSKLEVKDIINKVIELNKLKEKIDYYLKNKKPISFVKVKKLY